MVPPTLTARRVLSTLSDLGTVTYVLKAPSFSMGAVKGRFRDCAVSLMAGRLPPRPGLIARDAFPQPMRVGGPRASPHLPPARRPRRPRADRAPHTGTRPRRGARPRRLLRGQPDG